MINITRRIDELQKIVDGNDDRMEPDVKRKYLAEIREMKTILNWIAHQCSDLAEGTYNSGSKELKFVMKNTTRFHFRTLNFSLIAGEGGTEKTIPVTVTDWRPGRTKQISIYHDFNNDWSYRTRTVIKLKNRADSVEYELAGSRSGRNAGLKGSGARNHVTGYSKKQGYLVTIRSFCDNVPEYDLRAKARRLEGLIIDIFDIMSKRQDLRARTRKFMVVYLPTVCRTLDDYQSALTGNNTGEEMKALREKTHETLNLSITAFQNLKEDIGGADRAESEVDLEIMKTMMREEGLL